MNVEQEGVTLRFPATANLAIDSRDRTSGGAGNFLINNQNSILNGFFTRLAVNEVILYWCCDNVSGAFNNNTLTWTELGAGSATYTITIPDGQYTVSSLLAQIQTLMNASASPRTYSIVNSTTIPGKLAIQTSNASGLIWDTSNPDGLWQQLGLPIGYSNPPTNTLGWVESDIACPVLLPLRYVDFVSAQLTYNQDLKDANTNQRFNRDLLYRWHFAWDEEPTYDVSGYPIYQGYKSFIQRRTIAFPKQIKWNHSQPIGQLSFQVYGSNGELLPGTAEGQPLATPEFEWAMNLLVSES